MPALSPVLKWLLGPETNSHDGVSEVLRSPVLIEETRQALPSLQAAARQLAGEAGVREVIGKRFAIYPQPDRSPGEWAAWWSEYVASLGDLPWGALESAMRAWVKSPEAEFLPKPGRLRDMARQAPYQAAIMYERASKVVMIASRREDERLAYEKRQAEIAAMRGPKSKEEVQSVKDMLADFHARNAAKAEQMRSLTPNMPNTAGKTDAGGLTERMRAVMASRA